MVLVTGVGSLPHRAVDSALSCVFRYCPEIPFLPQLPRLRPDEFMLTQPFQRASHLFETFSETKLVLDPESRTEFLYSVENDDGSGSLLAYRALQDFSTKFDREERLALKAQWVGPITLLSCLRIGDEEAWSDSELSEAVVSLLIRQVQRLIEVLKDHHERVVFVLDEPMFGSESQSEPLIRVLQSVDQVGGVVGVHSCASCCPPDFFSLPAKFFSFVQEGQGVVQTVGLEWVDRKIVTPTCGLAGFSEGDAEEILSKLQER